MTPRQAAARARAQGYRWIVMEWNDYGNWARGDEMRDACDAEGLAFTIWMTRDFSAADARAAVIASRCTGIVSEGEIPAYAQGQPNPQAQDWVELDQALSDLPIAKGVATSWSPFQGPDGKPAPAIAKPLIEAGWHCLPYVYPAESPGASIDRAAFYASHFTHEAAPGVLAPGQGWYAIEPVLGCYSGAYGSFTLDDFPGRHDCLGWSVWAAEYVL